MTIERIISTSQANKYRIYYTGAPYGDSEEGALISTHRTASGTLKKWQALQNHAKYYRHTTMRDSAGNKIEVGDLL